MSKRRLIWLVLWGCSLAMISFRGGAISYGLFFFFSFLPILSFLYLLICLFEFRIYQTLQSRVVTAGTPTGYEFILENSGFISICSITVQMYPDFSYVEELPDKSSFELLPGESFRYKTKMVCRYRGSYPVGVKSLVLTDFLNLFRIRYKNRTPLSAIVNTRIPSEDELSFSDEFSVWQRKENRLKMEEPDCVVRDYADGDSLRLIHWNASAASMKLKSRTLTGEQQGEVSVFFDTRRTFEKEADFLPVENKVLETVLFFTQYFALSGQPVSITSPSDSAESMESFHSQSVPTLSEFESFYDRLQGVFFSERREDSMLSAFLTELRGELQTSLIVLVMQSITLEEASVLNDLTEDGYSLLVCLVAPAGTHISSVLKATVLPLYTEGRVRK